MTTELATTARDWTVGFRVWLERGGRPLLGPGRVELLERIDRAGSISAAAREMRMSYRRAWLLVKGMNEAAGEPLVEAAPGGPGGGGARLTPLGRWGAAAYRRMQGRVQTGAAFPLAPPGEPAVHVAAAASLEEVLGQVQADYAAAAPGASPRFVFGASDELAEMLIAGAPADLFLSADARQMERVDAAGLTLPGSHGRIASNGLAVVGPGGGGPAVRSPADLLRPEAGRIAVARPSSPLGRYTRAYLEAVGLHEALAPRLVAADGARSVTSVLRAGRADLAIVYASDAARADGCRLLFRARRLPEPVHYTAALLRRSDAAPGARAFLDFLSCPAARRRFRLCGFLHTNGR